MHNRYQTWVQSNAKGIGKRFPFLPSFDFCPLKANAKDSLLAWCEEIASCRDFIRVTVTERRKARASSTNTNKLFSLLFLKLLEFKSLKRNISSEGHDSNDSKNQWAHGQVQKKHHYWNTMDLTKVNFTQPSDNSSWSSACKLPKSPPARTPSRTKSSISYNIHGCNEMLDWKRCIHKFIRHKGTKPDSTFYSEKSESCHKSIAHLSAPWTFPPIHAYQTSVPPIVAPTFGFHIEGRQNPSIKTKQ